MNIEEVLEFAQKVSNCMSRELINRKGIPATDLEDISQEMLVGILEALPQFKPQKCNVKAFVCQKAKDIKIELLRKYRNNCGFTSSNTVNYDAVISEDENGESITFADILDEEAYSPSRRNHSLTKLQEFDLSLDVDEMLECMTLEHKKVCRLALSGVPVKKIAHEIGVARDFFYKKILPEIQAQMRQRGFAEKLFAYTFQI